MRHLSPILAVPTALALLCAASVTAAEAAPLRPTSTSMLATGDSSGAVRYAVTLKSADNGFLSAVNGGGGDVTSAKNTTDGWEKLTLTDLDGGTLTSGDTVYLQSSSGNYLSAQWGGGAMLDATRTHHLSWETFTLQGAATGAAIDDGDSVWLRTTVRPRWVKTTGGSGAVLATAEKRGPSGRFVVSLKRTTAQPTVPAAPQTQPASSSPDQSDSVQGSGPFLYPAPGGPAGPGRLPARSATSDYLGKMKFDQPTDLDLGFSGVVNGQSVWTFGDTLMPTGGNADQFTASDSVGLGDRKNPLAIHQKNLNGFGWPGEWIPLTSQEQADGGLGRYAEGGTNVVEYAPGKGLVWFLKNNRGANGPGIMGAGVATVTADATGARATRTMDTMWGPDEPFWGDIGVTYDPQDKKVYVYGHGPGKLGDNTYLARVPAEKATQVEAYEYWNQSAKSWGTQRFTLDGRNGTVRLSADQAIFTYAAVGQSNAFWSEYYNTWMFVGGAGWLGSDALVMTAPRLEGPWTKQTSVASTCPTGKCGTWRYAITPHPEYDPSGKTLLITWTDSNQIHASRVTWQ